MRIGSTGVSIFKHTTVSSLGAAQPSVCFYIALVVAVQKLCRVPSAPKALALVSECPGHKRESARSSDVLVLEVSCGSHLWSSNADVQGG